MDLEKITVVGMPEEITLNQINLINEHLKELSIEKIEINPKIKKIYSNLKATKRKIIVSNENFIKYKIRDFDENANFSPNFYIAEKEFEYRV